jgi:hypothetical protein
VGFSGSRAIANIFARTIAANVTADNGLIKSVEAAGVQRSIVASNGSIIAVTTSGSAGINLLPGSQISARNGINRITAPEINATIIAHSGNPNGGHIDLLQTTSGGFSGSLQATNVTNTTPGTSGLVTAGTLTANVTLEGSVQSRVVAPSATGAMLVKQSVSGPMTTTAGGFTNLNVNGSLTTTLTMASIPAGATITINNLAGTGRVVITSAHAGNLNFGASSPTVIKGLGSQVILNSGNATPNAWTGNIRYAGGTLLLPTITYDDTPADLGGGAVGLAAFRF